MKIHNGIIEIGIIENTETATDQTGLLYAQFVFYPDSQQLQVWLPETKYYKSDYGNFLIKNMKTHIIEEQGRVEDKVSGSIKMVFDTLYLQEGNYILEVEHPIGGKLLLHFQKFYEGYSPEKITPAAEPSTKDSMWKVYKDGFGNEIPNEDYAIRQQVDGDLDTVFKQLLIENQDPYPRLEYVDQGRSGKIFYVNDNIRILFYHELGGGACKMYIDIPNEASWEKATNTPLSLRREILLFVASGVIRDQAPSWRFEIHEDAIKFY